MAQQGIYFSALRSELVSHTSDDLPPGSDWEQLSADPTLGLVSARTLAVQHGLLTSEAAAELYWFMPQPEREDRLPAAFGAGGLHD